MLRSGRFLLALLLVIVQVVVLVAVNPVDARRSSLRPDGCIKLVGDAGWLGDNIYNTTGSRQTRATTVAPGGVAEFRVGIQSDGGSFRVSGTGGSAAFPTTYRYAGNIVTGRVVAGTLSFNNLPGGAIRTLAVQVRVGAGVAVGASRTVQVTTTSTANALERDVVRARVNVVTPPNRAPAFPNNADMHWTTVFNYTSGVMVGIVSHLSVSACVDPDGDPVTYTWTPNSFSSGTVNGNISSEFTGTRANWVRLRGDDPQGRSGYYSGDVTVKCSDPSGAFDSYTEQNMGGAG